VAKSNKHSKKGKDEKQTNALPARVTQVAARSHTNYAAWFLSSPLAHPDKNEELKIKEEVKKGE